MICLILLVLVTWNILLTWAIFEPNLTIYYPVFDKDGLWWKKSWIGGHGSGTSWRIIKWPWYKD